MPVLAGEAVSLNISAAVELRVSSLEFTVEDTWSRWSEEVEFPGALAANLANGLVGKLVGEVFLLRRFNFDMRLVGFLFASWGLKFMLWLHCVEEVRSR